MPLCAVPGCYKNGVHLFPKNPDLKKRWEKAIRRKNFVATMHSRICRDHFRESDYMGESAYTGKPWSCFMEDLVYGGTGYNKSLSITKPKQFPK